MDYETDKLSHGLLDEYIAMFDSFKDRELTFLEIGIFRGGSLKFWSDYFTHPATRIVGVDLNLPDVDFPDNVTVHQCNQLNTFGLQNLAERYGSFDIIVDDGAHQRQETENCFKVLWDHVKVGGYYVIEDWAVGYWRDRPGYAGMVELITKIMEQAPELRIAAFNIILAQHKAMAFFQKGETGWRD